MSRQSHPSKHQCENFESLDFRNEKTEERKTGKKERSAVIRLKMKDSENGNKTTKILNKKKSQKQEEKKGRGREGEGEGEKKFPKVTRPRIRE